MMKIQTYAIVEYDDDDPKNPTLRIWNSSKAFYEKYPGEEGVFGVAKKKEILVVFFKPDHRLPVTLETLRYTEA